MVMTFTPELKKLHYCKKCGGSMRGHPYANNCWSRAPRGSGVAKDKKTIKDIYGNMLSAETVQAMFKESGLSHNTQKVIAAVEASFDRRTVPRFIARSDRSALTLEQYNEVRQWRGEMFDSHEISLTLGYTLAEVNVAYFCGTYQRYLNER